MGRVGIVQSGSDSKERIQPDPFAILSLDPDDCDGDVDHLTPGATEYFLVEEIPC